MDRTHTQLPSKCVFVCVHLNNRNGKVRQKISCTDNFTWYLILPASVGWVTHCQLISSSSSSPSLLHCTLLMQRMAFGFYVSTIRSYWAACLWCLGKTANLNSEIILWPQSPTLINSNSLWCSGLNLHNPLDQYFVTGTHTHTFEQKSMWHIWCSNIASSVIWIWGQAIKDHSLGFLINFRFSISDEMVTIGQMPKCISSSGSDCPFPLPVMLPGVRFDFVFSSVGFVFSPLTFNFFFLSQNIKLTIRETTTEGVLLFFFSSTFPATCCFLSQLASDFSLPVSLKFISVSPEPWLNTMSTCIIQYVTEPWCLCLSCDITLRLKRENLKKHW